MEKIIYRKDLEEALKKIEADLHDVYHSSGVYNYTSLGTHICYALSAVSGALAYVNQFEER